MGCRDALPHLQHLAVYMVEAMSELETAFDVGGGATGHAEATDARAGAREEVCLAA